MFVFFCVFYFQSPNGLWTWSAKCAIVHSHQLRQNDDTWQQSRCFFFTFLIQFVFDQLILWVIVFYSLCNADIHKLGTWSHVKLVTKSSRQSGHWQHMFRAIIVKFKPSFRRIHSYTSQAKCYLINMIYHNSNGGLSDKLINIRRLLVFIKLVISYILCCWASHWRNNSFKHDSYVVTEYEHWNPPFFYLYIYWN